MPVAWENGTPVTIDQGKAYSFARHHEDILSMSPYSLETKTGARGWGKNVIPQVRITPPKPGQIQDRSKVIAIVHNGKLYARQAYGLALAGQALVIGENGEIVAKDPDTERELWRAVVHGEAREIAVAEGRVYVGTSSGTIYCFEPSARGAETAVAIHDPAGAIRAAPQPPPPVAMTKILEQLRHDGMDRGFALVLGDADGEFSTALAANTRLRVVNAMTDEAAATALRERLLAQTAWYGARVQVHLVKSLDPLPFSQFFANAVIVAGPVPGLSAKELYRVLHPCGGVLLAPGLKPTEAESLLKDSGATDAEIRPSTEGPFVVRGKLPGALDWDLKGGRADQRVKWPLRPLWFGGPGTREVQGFRGLGGDPWWPTGVTS